MVYTGTSSMDIRLTLLQGPRTEPRITALFTFVARDPNTQKATKVPPLVPQTSEQRQRFQERSQIAKELKAARKAAAAQGGLGGRHDVYGDGQGSSAAGQQAKRREWANELLAEATRMSRMPGEHAADPESSIDASTCINYTLRARHAALPVSLQVAAS